MMASTYDEPPMPGDEYAPVTNVRDIGTWRSRLSYGGKSGDTLKTSLGNVALILEHDTAWRGVFGYDERSESPVLLAKPPWRGCPSVLLDVPRPLMEGDDTRTVIWLEENYSITPSAKMAHTAVNAVAEAHRFDRVREYLNELRWDGTERLSRWPSDFLGCDHNAYTAAVGRRWMISAVARTFEPGCKADHALVLEGAQGLGKSSALRVLAGDQYFSDDIPPIGSKDAQQWIGDRWIVELAEMDAASKAEAATLKRFLTTQSDRYRPPYGSRTIEHGRRCVFAGSVNLDEYLRDPTGGRRFWPLRCTAVLLEALAVARDQLWAEAVHAYRKGEPWHLDDDEAIRLANEEQSTRLERDPWHDTIAEYLEPPHRTFVTTPEILEKAIGVKSDRQDKSHSNRVGTVVRALGGWGYTGGGGRVRGWKRHA